MPSTETLLVTPDAAGRVEVPARAQAVFPAACYVEDPPPPADNLAYLGDIWAEGRRGLELARRAASLSHALARRMTEIIEGGPDEAALPLTLDFATHFVEAALERMVRVADAAALGGRLRLSPARLRHVLDRPATGRLFKAAQKKQAFQWLVLRLVAGAPDDLVWREAAAPVRLRNRWRRTLWLRHEARAEGDAEPALFAAHLGRGEALFRSLEVPLRRVPDLVQPFVLRRDRATRARLGRAFVEALEPTFREHGVDPSGLARLAELFGEMLPPTRLETRRGNAERYTRFFDTHAVRGFLTATGQGKYDPNLFFMAECHRRGRPTVIVQHGGQYGYDDKIPSFFTMDMGLPSVFVSWGWTRFPGPYDRGLQRARIVPLPEPRMSELRRKGAARPAPEGPATLLVPLSKFRTLDNRVGGNATDGVVSDLRGAVRDVIAGLQGDVARFLVTYRGGSFETDPLRPFLAGLPSGRVEVFDSKRVPASTLLERAHGVLWDVTATGLFETLHYGLPTVALLRRGRWAAEAAWAERLVAEAGIGAYDPLEAVRSLRRFLSRPEEWQAARLAVQPLLDAFAAATDDCGERWREFLRSL